MAGWIKLHRKMLEWEWYDDINVCRLWTHLLLKANHKPNNWKGIAVQAGQCVTGRHSLAKETGLTEQQIRTALNKLKSTGEVTSKIYSKFSVITITSWNEYQQDNQQNNHQSTSNQPASNHKQECKELENGKKVKKKPLADPVDFSVFDLSESDLAEVKRIRVKNKGGAITTQRVANGLAKEIKLALEAGMTIDDLLTEWETRGWKSFKAAWATNTGGNNGSHQRASTQRGQINHDSTEWANDPELIEFMERHGGGGQQDLCPASGDLPSMETSLLDRPRGRRD